jgi:rhodanese-related sulfurtransferase
MQLLNFIKNLFGGTANANLPENNTSHPAPKFENQDGKAFKTALKSDKNAILLDVRTAGEVQGGALPGAVNIDYMSMSFRKKIAELDKAKTYFVYCRSGARSMQACNIMHQQGFDVRNLDGGIGAFPSK